MEEAYIMKFGNNKPSYVSSVEAPTDLRSFLGEGTEITGEIRFSEIMRVDANISGIIVSDSGSLLIMERGRVKARDQAGFVEVSGTVEGTTSAKNHGKV